ncbi:P-loop containing nucleoside triphosphate hydrolase protein [Obba rivulosa]|uniref:P-loop containing nucleoside triphosphate hydrolase protein n=1 Tax=Obba rivulosa TaxID=1052685 RepID=A0A8E2J785_9APHY|nr:P-loop containing nucleoside triphosphate hydrolase protein [Obba rivulosa]
MFKATLPRCNVAAANATATVSTQKFYSARSAKAFPIFQDSGAAQFLAAAGTIESIPELHGGPEVIFTGRANVGKSSLLNLILGRNKLASTSKKPGHTKTLNFFGVSRDPRKLVIVDGPGYGARGRPEWGQAFEHYIQNRPSLKRVYILFDIKHGLTPDDKAMLMFLDEACQKASPLGWTLQAVITKASWTGTIPSHMVAIIERLTKNIFAFAPTCLPPIITSSKRPVRGLFHMRQNIVEAIGAGSAKIRPEKVGRAYVVIEDAQTKTA